MGFRSASPVLLFLTACSGARFTALEQGGAEVRVVVARAGAMKTATALAGSAPFEIDVDPVFARGDALEVWVFGYSVAQLVNALPALAGKTAEEIAAMLQPTVGARDDHEPPAADRVLFTKLTKGAAESVTYTESSWVDWEASVTEGNALAFSVEPTRMRPPASCGFGQPKVQPLALPATMDARWAIPLKSGGVFVGSTDYKLFRVGLDRSVTAFDVPQNFQIQAADSDDGETVWVGDVHLGRAVIRDRIVSYDLVLRPDAHNGVARLAVKGDEVYTLNFDGALERYDASTRRFEVLHKFAAANTYGGLVILGPRHVVAAASTSTTLVRVKDGVKTEETIPGALSTIGALADVPGFGLVAGTTGERVLFAHDGTRWEMLRSSHTDVFPCVIAPFAGGLFVAGQYGQAAVYTRETGVCYHQPIAPGALHWVSPFGRDGILVAGDASHAGLQVTVVTPF